MRGIQSKEYNFVISLVLPTLIRTIKNYDKTKQVISSAKINKKNFTQVKKKSWNERRYYVKPHQTDGQGSATNVTVIPRAPG